MFMLNENSWDQYESYHPQLPESNDPRWRQVMVRVHGPGTAELRTYPEDQYSDVILYVYTGDLISVIKESRLGYWIAAKVGYKIGWLNIYYVNFTLTKVFDTYATPQESIHETGWLEEETDQAVPQELLTSEVEAFRDELETPTEPRVTPKDLRRIIKHLKNFGFGRSRRVAQSG